MRITICKFSFTHPSRFFFPFFFFLFSVVSQSVHPQVFCSHPGFYGFIKTFKNKRKNTRLLLGQDMVGYLVLGFY